MFDDRPNPVDPAGRIGPPQETPVEAPAPVDYQTSPAQYRHWRLSFDGPVATLKADFDENAGLRPGYKLKLNSYDLGVDIELADALNRIRFEHPEVQTVVLTSARDKVFCSGANIFMLGLSSHAWKVNFCKFTNETRNGIEDSSRDGLKFLAAVNGACAGGGYELALACDEILLVDDRSSSVSLPEVPLLGVLPGTGGLTRVTDKRRVRHDLADIFCTTAEGVRGQRAKDWRLVDEIAKPAQFAAKVQERALELAKGSQRPGPEGVAKGAQGVALTPLARTIDADALRYSQVQVQIDRARRTATLTLHAPQGPVLTDIAAIEAAGAAWYPLALARELDDAVLHLRSNEPEIGLWLLKTEGDAAAVLQSDAVLLAQREQPDLILMDISLPVMDGWEATEHIRKIESIKNVPIIALTAHALVEDRNRSLAIGCNDFETKPINFSQLIVKINALLGTNQNQ